MNTAATPPTLQAARWATDLSTALGVDEITTTGGSGPEIVTAVSPRMMTRPVTEPASAASASCQTTDDTAAARVGDMVTVEVTYAAPHHLVADRVLGVRRTRSGDAWEARTSAPVAAGVGLGMPTVGVPAPLPDAPACR